MRYFTRELFDAMQPGPGDPETDRAIAVWRRNVNEYHTYLQELKPKLSDGFAWLAETTLHDGLITNVDTMDPNHIVLTVDASNNPWGQTGLVKLTFSDVLSHSGLMTCREDGWLYEELHESGEHVELRVLLETGEIRITARHLQVALSR